MCHRCKECEVCGRKFADHDAFLQHYRAKHALTGAVDWLPGVEEG